MIPKVYSFSDLMHLAGKLDAILLNMRPTPERDHIANAANAIRLLAQAPTRINNEIEYTRSLAEHFADTGYRRPLVEGDALAKHMFLMISTLQGVNRELMKARFAVYKPIQQEDKSVIIQCRLCGEQDKALDRIPHKPDCSFYDARREYV